jgi:zinc protease
VLCVRGKLKAHLLAAVATVAFSVAGSGHAAQTPGGGPPGGTTSAAPGGTTSAAPGGTTAETKVQPGRVIGSAPDGVLRDTLPNGLRVVIVPDRLAPVVTTELNYLVGSNDAPAGFPGTAHALEHMMFRGSAGLDRDQLSELGALLGGSYNADTTETVTQYFYTVPAVDLEVALRMEASRMNGLSLKQEDWDKERGAIEQEVSRDLSSPFYTYLSQLQAINFAGTPYAHDALGTRPSFDKTDATLLRHFYETWYAPNNAILVIVGDVDAPRALAQVRAAFGAIPRRDVPAHADFTLRPVQAETLHLPTDLPLGVVTLAYRMPGLKSKDFAVADILGDVLGSQRGALYGLVPAGRALLAEYAYQPKSDVGYALALAGFPKGGDPAPLLADMRGVIADIVKNGVSPELVAASRRQELAQLAFKSDSISGLAESWSRALAFQGADSPDDLARQYASVTVEDVNRLARETLTPDKAVTAILTPVDHGKPVAGGGFGGAESFGTPPTKPVALPAWASSALENLTLPPPAAQPNVSVLANGLRLIVQPEHVGHTISVFGEVRQVTDMQEAPGREGVADLASSLFSYGTTSLDRLAYQKALDDIAAQESAGSGFSLKVLTPQFEAGMKLLADNELHPAFPPEAFGVVRRQTAQGLAGLLHSPDYLVGRALKSALVPAGDPTLRQATPATVMALTPPDLNAFYHAAYRPDLTTIVVAGDVTPERARQVVEETFGGWKAEGKTPSIDLPPVGPNTRSAVRIPDPTSVQDSATLAETIPLAVTDKQRFTLMLGNTILGGGFFSRLYGDLRIRTGYVYSVESALSWHRTRSDYTVSFGCDPQNVDRARALVARDIAAMQNAPVSDLELTRAKAQMLRHIPMQLASIDSIAGTYLRLADLGLPLDTLDVAAKQVFSATPADVQAAFRANLRPDDLAQVVKGPPPAP